MELVVTIVILAILAIVAAPKFLNLSQSATKSMFKGLYGNFSSAVSMSHSCWVVRGEESANLNLTCGYNGTLNSLDYNESGYPVGTGENTGSVNKIDHVPDCGYVWEGLIETELQLWADGYESGPFVPKAQADIYVEFLSNGVCRYSLIHDTSQAFDYDSDVGTVRMVNPSD